MKKISLILALTLVLVSAFAAVALADPSQPNNGGGAIATPYSDGTPGAAYLPTVIDGSAIHSNYAANTDACSACHAAHTGNGANLLQWNWTSLTDICMTCHDGTVTKTYDVKAGKVADTGTNSSAGLFAVQHDGAGNLSASEHGVFSGLKVSAAYGGAIGATAADANGAWTADFSCTSCHTPHGQGGNDRILDPNPNFIQTGGKDPSVKVDPVTLAPVDYKGIYGAILGTANGTTNKFYFNTATVDANTKDANGAAVTAITAANNVPIIGDRLAKPTIWVGGVKQTTGYRFSFDPGTKNAYVLFTTAPAAGTVTADYIPVLQVKVTVANKLTNLEAVTNYSGINVFCGACHTDYNTTALELAKGAPYNNLNGTYSKHTRHGVGGENVKFAALQPSENGKLSCITCHYAHGVDQNRWAETATKVGIPAYNSSELAGSSKLKRLPNMGVCEVCHQKELDAYSANNAIAW